MRIFIYLCNVFRKRHTFYCSTFPERTTTSEKITSKTNSHWSVHYKCRLHRREFEAVVGLRSVWRRTALSLCSRVSATK